MSSLNKTALVTGSTSGIGLATARALAKRGVNIIITGFGDENAISSIVDEIKGYGVRADYVFADLSKVTDIDNLWLKVTQLYPEGVDILVNNAGFSSMGPVEDVSDSDWDLHIAVMLSAPFYLIKRVLPAMRVKGWGRIIATSSAWGLVAVPNAAPYVAAKHGLIGLIKGVALESAPHGITCNAVCPGVVTTPLYQTGCEQFASTLGVTVEDVMNMHKADCPVGKFNTPEQVAELIEFLCLSNASSQMTGAAYLIDYGYTAK